MSKKLTQWYIDKGEANNQLETQPFNNFFPWKTYRSLDLDRFKKFIEDPMSNQWFSIFVHFGLLGMDSRYLIGTDDPYTEIKYVNQSNYESTSYNIFPFHIWSNGVHQGIFTCHPETQLPIVYHMFKNLPDEILTWLRQHPDCRIAFIDQIENKKIADYIDILENIRNKFQLQNEIIWNDAGISSEKILSYESPDKPTWLKFGSGGASWLQNILNIKKGYDSWPVSNKDIPKEDDMLTNNDFSKARFLCYIGRFKYHRCMYASYLLSDPQVKNRTLIDLNYDHFTNKNALFDTRDIELEYYRQQTLNPEQLKYLDRLIDLGSFYYQSLNYSSFPEDLRDDKTKLDVNPYFWKPDPRHYKNIFFDISPETFSDRGPEPLKDNYRDMLTEKTAKPILAYRPFMMSGMPNRLRELKKLGFQTFDHWIDESYDQDISAPETYAIMMKNLSMIANWSDGKCTEVFNEMIPVLRHNRRRLEEIIYNEPKFWIQSVLKLFQSDS